jgi:hypothetical protein
VRIIEEHEDFFPGLSPLAPPGITLAVRGADTLRVTVQSHLLRQQHVQVLDTRGRVRERHQAGPRRWDGREGL